MLYEKICAGCGVSFTHQRQRVRYCTVACHHRTNKVQPTAGHRAITKNGYVRLTLGSGLRVLEHRWVWEQANGPIPAGGIIHHVNEMKTDNRLSNLRLVANLSEHNRAHGGSIRYGTGKA